MHAARALAHPRWEDFNYEYLDASQNRLHWLGDGNTVADRDPNGDSKGISIFYYEANFELTSNLQRVGT